MAEISIGRNERVGEAGDLATAAPLIIDPRLAGVWQFLWDYEQRSAKQEGGPAADVLATALRLAYLQGYADARDEDGVAGLYAELGLRREVKGAQLEGRRSPRAPAKHGNSGM